MLEVANRVKEGYLDVEDIDNFPCEDLRTIDQLWTYYSDYRFGFSVQKEIYLSLGGKKEYNEGKWFKFCDKVGWRKKEGKWVEYKYLTHESSFNPSRGYLPHVSMRYERSGCKEVCSGVVRSSLMYRLKECGL